MVPPPPPKETTPQEEGDPSKADSPTHRAIRIAWAVLKKRVFDVDTRCDHCGGPLRMVAAVTDPASIRRFLEHMGLPTEPPRIAPARAPPQEELDLGWN